MRPPSRTSAAASRLEAVSCEVRIDPWITELLHDPVSGAILSRVLVIRSTATCEDRRLHNNLQYLKHEDRASERRQPMTGPTKMCLIEIESTKTLVELSNFSSEHKRSMATNAVFDKELTFLEQSILRSCHFSHYNLSRHYNAMQICHISLKYGTRLRLIFPSPLKARPAETIDVECTVLNWGTMLRRQNHLSGKTTLHFLTLSNDDLVL
ncbi:uncharacterized protein MYCFIDRAFT_172583 [Pseudocercospora fijiensis CIRAD86]|uniref:Uncharacterized protein n=1 Tax=Pseudocercospora fijiensis (strain CIRAD86) TaxID=383855 RepID=M3BC78_PSEFD|nr:uncharacterized protein MYCFIDRAFT_172583 [Pseudocercospora fijiensis CIRAD86]EME86887.1 hypothetical protein MYCFIDRAFT_172583 [Pseudocercospora fijiensis CIRAD86]